MEVTEERA